jgi:hypothetical protein
VQIREKRYIYLVGAIIAMLLGLVIALIQGTIQYLFLLLAITIPLWLSLRKLTSPKFRNIWSTQTEKTPNDNREYKITRILYYTGTMFLGEVAIRPVSGITISDLFYLVSLILLFLIMLIRKKVYFPKTSVWLVVGLFIFVIGGLLSSFGTFSPVSSVARVLRVPYIVLVWFILGTVVLNQPKYIKKAMIFWIISMTINGAIAIAQLKLNIPLTSNQFGRMTAFTDHFNDLGGSCSIAWVPALALATTTKGFKNIFFYLCLIAVGMGVMLSGSVSGIITVGVGTLLWIIMGRPNKKMFISIGLLAAFVFIVIQIQSANGYVTPMSRFQSTTSSGQNGTVLNRFETYQVALQDIENNPFVGVGFDDASNKTSTGFEVHNIFLGPLYQGGMFALFGILIITCVVIYMGVYISRNALSLTEYVISSSLLISYLCTIIFGMTAPLLYQRYAWIPAALILPLYIQRRLKEKQSLKQNLIQLMRNRNKVRHAP